MSETDHASVLLKAASEDFEAMVGMAQMPNQFADSIFGFHVQQAIEKSIKAWLTRKGITYPYTHDLNALLNLLSGAGEDVITLRSLVRWNDFAVHHRYASIGLDDDEPLDRPAAVAEVRSLMERVRQYVVSPLAE